jgi:hypothetical protein
MSKIHKCSDGHRQDDVCQIRVVDHKGIVVGYRYRCRRCKTTLVVPSYENLIGNPFDVKEKRDDVKDELVLKSLEVLYEAQQ